MPRRSGLADAIHYLKLSFAKRLRSRPSPEKSGGFWQKRYYDRNVRSYREFVVKLRYLHRNPVKRGLVSKLEDWKWSSYRHYAFREIGIVEIESEWTARDREQKARGGVPRIFLRAQVSAQNRGANLGHQAPGDTLPQSRGGVSFILCRTSPIRKKGLNETWRCIPVF